MPEACYLLLGGNGRLGAFLKGMLPNDAPTRQAADILRPETLESALARKAYSGVIHLAALTDPGWAAKHPQETYRTNVIGTRLVAALCAKHHQPLWYLSTDYVFDGREGNYCEADPPAPANWYGATKYAGELEVQEAVRDFCIIRTSFRPAAWGFPTAFTNVYTSADYTDIIAGEIAACVRQGVRGIIHIGTPVKTFYELAKQRNPGVQPEECRDDAFPKRRNLNIDRWTAVRRVGGALS